MTRPTTRRTRILLPWLTALALLLAGALAAAHELEHALEQHDEPACALHLLADHAGKALCAAAPGALTTSSRIVIQSPAVRATPCAVIASFHARAPPVSGR